MRPCLLVFFAVIGGCCSAAKLGGFTLEPDVPTTTEYLDYLEDEYLDLFGDDDGDQGHHTTHSGVPAPPPDLPDEFHHYFGFDLPCTSGYEKDKNGICREVLEVSGGVVCSPRYRTLIVLILTAGAWINYVAAPRR